ncbi:MAG TPA: putative glycoside hydrolase [Candidatus Eisenbacteria bacterium]|jgi:hypothetical protein
MPTSRVILAALLAAFVTFAPGSGLAAVPKYPRLGLYGSVLGGGAPYVKADGSLDTLEIGRAARYSEVVLDVYPISPYRPDIVQAMKARNPALLALAYVLAEDIWQVNDADSTHHIPTIIRHTVRNLNGFLYDKVTGLEYETLAINIAKKDASGRFVVADAMADIFRDHIIATGLWDGLFTDILCHTVSWTQLGTSRVIDYQRAGYASLADLDVAWAAATDTLAARIRQNGGPNFVLVGNCGPSSFHETYNGWMRENFPYQQGGTWYSNMLGDAGSRGYFADDRDYVQPPHNWILSATVMSPYTEYDPTNTRRVRYGLASASLGGGVAAFCPGKSINLAPYQDWWYDEYAVDTNSGRSTESLSNTGWLGQAIGPPYTMLWVGSAPDAITNTGFETSVTSGWTFAAFAPASATLSRDVTTAAVGTSSAKVHISAATTVDWYVNLTSVGQLAVRVGSSYSATFWCKASSPRIIHLVASNSGGRAYAAVDTTWRQYQVVIQPTLSINSTLAFFLGLDPGDVWFDDVHFQAGATSVWRRDFQNGIVLLNPTELTLDVPMGLPLRRIYGIHDMITNDGTETSTMRVNPADALFLLRAEQDHTPPGRISDLRVGP